MTTSRENELELEIEKLKVLTNKLLDSVSELKEIIKTKADKSDLQAVANDLDKLNQDKADKSDLQAVANDLDKLNQDKADKSDILWKLNGGDGTVYLKNPWGLNLLGQTIYDVLSPTHSNHAATKSYVDEKLKILQKNLNQMNTESDKLIEKESKKNKGE